jgi:hypothetical protein
MFKICERSFVYVCHVVKWTVSRNIKRTVDCNILASKRPILKFYLYSTSLSHYVTHFFVGMSLKKNYLYKMHMRLKLVHCAAAALSRKSPAITRLNG